MADDNVALQLATLQLAVMQFMALQFVVALHRWWVASNTIAMAGEAIFFFFFFLFSSFKSFQLPLRVSLRKREKKNERKKNRNRVLKPPLGYITLHLVSFFLAPPISALLVCKSVTTQVPSSSRNTSNNNINNKKKFKKSKSKEICYFQH
jgi:hypothetical protein